MTLTLSPNAEALVSGFLRCHEEVEALCAGRVYTALPTNPTFPAVRVTLFSDSPSNQTPVWLVASTLQVEAWGGSKLDAWRLAETCRSAISADIAGQHAEGTVSGADVSGLTDDPDEDYEPAKPRFLFVCTVYAHPLIPSPGS